MPHKQPFLLIIGVAILGAAVMPLRAEVNPAGILGQPPRAPADVSGLPGGGPKPKTVTGGFSVNTSSREQVREFYNAVFTASEGVPINSTAVTASCVPGTNSPAFVAATLQRINWYRALAGLPASITFNSGESTKDQEAAVMMSEHGALQHVGSWAGWDCFDTDATNASANSNLALGNDGPDAITSFIWDFGSGNSEVGHRRWILYPQTQVMGTGDVPPEGSYSSANATWIFDANYGGPRPATRTPYVTWPPAGFVPYQVVFPQWSFALSNANLSAATVTMTSNGVPVAITLQPYQTGYGENTLVWYPSSLDPTTSTSFPFSGTDTVYAITVNNVSTPVGTESYSYAVTVFNPATTGADYSPLVISGPGQPTVNAANAYSCTASTNPAITGYWWLTAQATNGNLADNALNGLVNFTISPTPIYPIITNPVTGPGLCFHLTHTNPAPQLLQFKETLYPSNTTMVSFESLLGYATPDEVARVQVSTDGGTTWQDIYTQAGDNSSESSFTPHSLSLASYAGENTQLRFNYDYIGGSHYINTDNDIGWSIENVILTNTLQLVNQATNATSSTNFVFTPTQAGNYVLQARGVIYTEFPTDLGTAKLVTAVVLNSVPNLAITFSSHSLTLSWPAINPNTLLQTTNLASGVWTTNTTFTATSGTNSVTVPLAAGDLFFRLRSP